MSRSEPITLPTPSTPQRQRFCAWASGQAFDTRNAAGVTEINFFDEVGSFGISAAAFQDKLAGTGDVVLKLNSPGGDVFDGIAIYNALLAHPGHVRVEIVGVAASAASIIAMAGDEIAVAENAFVMIHDAWGGTIGNRHEHAETADLLGQIDDSLAGTYSRKTGIDIGAIKKMMDAETWLEGADAVAAGFATELLKPAERRAKFDLSVFAKVPEGLLDKPPKRLAANPSAIDNPRDFEAFLRDAGLSRSQATAVTARGFKAAQADRDDREALAELAAHITAQAETITSISGRSS